MKRILVILGREYRLRLRRPSFWVLTLLVPLLIAALYALPVVAAHRAQQRPEELVVDETGMFAPGLKENSKEVSFREMPSLEFARRTMDEVDSVKAILFFPARAYAIPTDAFFFHRDASPSRELMSVVDSRIQSILRTVVLQDVYNLDPDVYHSVNSLHVRLHAQDAATGHEDFGQVKSVVAMTLAVLMVVALLLFGVQVMRSVQEEKATRVAEVVLTSVRPEELMTGKISGVALAALTQLVLWVGLGTATIHGVQATDPDLFAQAREQQQHRAIATKGEAATAQYNTPVSLVDETVQGLTAINLPLLAGVFVLFFLLGYLMYGGLLAALAARLDSDADALQWVLLVMSPLLLCLLLSPIMLRAPTEGLAVWLTYIPFTAPATVLLRLPFGIGAGAVVLSVLLLVLAFAGSVAIAARSYRRYL